MIVRVIKKKKKVKNRNQTKKAQSTRVLYTKRCDDPFYNCIKTQKSFLCWPGENKLKPIFFTRIKPIYIFKPFSYRQNE